MGEQAKLEPLEVYSYGGGPVEFLDGDTLVYKCGAGLHLRRLGGDEEEVAPFLWTNVEAVDCFTVNARRALLAFSPRMPSPPINIVAFPQGHDKGQLSGGSRLGYCQMAFVREGERLAALGHPREPKLFIWSVDTEAKLVETLLSTPASAITFNPADREMLATSGEGGLTVWKTNKLVDAYTVTPKAVALIPEGVQQPQLPLLGARHQAVTAHTWVLGNQLVAANREGELLVINADTAELLERIPTPNTGPSSSCYVVSLLLTLTHVVEVSSMGYVRWRSLKDLNRVERVANMPEGADKTSKVTSRRDRVVAVARSPLFDKLLLGTSQGRLLDSGLEVSPVQQAQAMASGSDAGLGDETAVAMDVGLGDYHQGAVLALANVCSGDEIFVSGGQDGCLRVWGGESREDDEDDEDDNNNKGGGSNKALGAAAAKRGRGNNQGGAAGGLGGGGGRGPAAASVVKGLKLLLAKQFSMEVEVEAGSTPAAGEQQRRQQQQQQGDGAAGMDQTSREVFSNDAKVVVATPVPITSLATMLRQRVLAVGTGGGCLSIFFMEEEPVNLVTMYTQRFFRHAVSHLAFSESDAYLAVASTMPGDGVHIMACSPDPGSDNFRVIGIWAPSPPPSPSAAAAPLPTPAVSAICWQGGQLLYSDVAGGLYAANPADAWATPEVVGETLPPFWRARLDSPSPVALASLPSKAGVMVLGSTINFLQTYKTPPAGEKPAADWAHLSSVGSTPAHDQTPVCLAVSPNGKFAATGAADGMVALYWLGGTLASDGKQQPAAPKKLDTAHLHQSAVVSLAFSRNSARLYSAGLDGDVFRLVLAGADAEKNTGQRAGFDRAKNQYKWQNINGTHVVLGGAQQQQSWLEAALEKIAQRKALQHDTYKSLNRQKLLRLGDKLRGMLDANEAAPELERLDREEFVLNTDIRDTQLKKNAEKANRLRQEIQSQDMGRHLVRARVLEMCWDSMEAQFKEVRAMARDGVSVSNFAVSKVGETSKRKLARVMQLRAMELRDIRRNARRGQRAWTGLMNEVPHGITWIINEGFFRPTTDIQDLYKRLQGRAQQQQQQQQPQAGPAAAAGKGAPAAGGKGSGSNHRSNQEEDEEDNKDFNVQVDEKSVACLLYPPEIIRTPNQKRTQIILTMEFIRQLKKKFNEHFDALFRAKEEEMEKSDGRNDRVSQILAELGSSEVVVKPMWSSGETPNKVLEVSPSEMKSTPYETEAMREVRKKAEEEKRRRNEEARKDNIGERALQDMMYGTLEAKSDALASAQALEKPKWMEQTPPEQWGEEQKAEAEAYEAKKKKVQEEGEKKKKELELELKKLRTEIADAYRAFDDKVKDLSDLKSFAQSVISQQELIVMRLSASLCHREDAAIENRRLEAKLRELSEQKAMLQHRIAVFRQHYEAQREEADRVQNEDRQLEKNFRKDLQDVSPTPIDQDTLKILLQLYKSRPRNVMHGGRASGGTGGPGSSVRGSSFGQSHRSQSHGRQSSSASSKLQMGPSESTRRKSTSQQEHKLRRRSSQGGGSKASSGNAGAEDLSGVNDATIEMKRHREKARGSEKDPFNSVEDAGDRGRRSSQIGVPDIAPLNQETDCPDGFVVQEAVWNRLQELRVAKILAELEVRKAGGKLSDLKKMFDAMVAEGEQLEAQVAAIQAKKFDTAETMAFKERNTEVLVRLKQGQAEVEQEAIVTDYSDTLFIPVNNVHQVNAEVVRLGSEKVKMLHKIKDFRKSINFMAWEHRYLGRIAADLEEHYKDLQLTRITRNLQELLNGNHLEKERQKLERGEARLGIMSKAHDDRLIKMRANNGMIAAKIRDKEEENRRLEKQLKDLRAAVEAREAIYRTRADGNGGNNTAAQASAKMKRITMRRRLVELAKSQTDEIEFLKQELDRLRQRTFPSFAHAARARMAGNPDEL